VLTNNTLFTSKQNPSLGCHNLSLGRPKQDENTTATTAATVTRRACPKLNNSYEPTFSTTVRTKISQTCTYLYKGPPHMILTKQIVQAMRSTMWLMPERGGGFENFRNKPVEQYTVGRIFSLPPSRSLSLPECFVTCDPCA
jgi:hypothetical protein